MNFWVDISCVMAVWVVGLIGACRLHRHRPNRHQECLRSIDRLEKALQVPKLDSGQPWKLWTPEDGVREVEDEREHVYRPVGAGRGPAPKRPPPRAPKPPTSVLNTTSDPPPSASMGGDGVYKMGSSGFPSTHMDKPTQSPMWRYPMNTDLELDIAAAATPGPWTWSAGLGAEGSERTWAGYPQRILGRNPDSTDTSPVLVAELYEGHEDEPPPNTVLITHARTGYPLALEVVKAAEEAITALLCWEQCEHVAFGEDRDACQANRSVKVDAYQIVRRAWEAAE